MNLKVRLKLLIVLLVINLLILAASGCQEEDSWTPQCPPELLYIHDYEYVTLDDGSVITGAPIYKCKQPGT